MSDKILEESGVLGDVNIEVFPLYFVPLERDVLSLCFEDAFRDLHLVCWFCQLQLRETDPFQYHDPTTIFLAAKALMTIQETHGLFPKIVGKGDNANRLMELLFRMRRESAAEEDSTTFGPMPSSHVEGLIIIDREVDMVTPLLTQLTYEGLIDERYGIKSNAAEVDTSIVGPLAAPPQANKATEATASKGLKRKIPLDSNDRLFDQIRDANFAIVDGLLNKVARRLQSDMQSRHEAKTTTELRDFVNKLPGYQVEQQNLKVHIGLTEDIIKYTQTDIFRRSLEIQQNLVDGTDPAQQHEPIEDLTARQAPLSTVLRLICLESCISGGLRQKDLDAFKTRIEQAYGYQHLLTLYRLEKMGLLQVRASATVLFNPLGSGAAAAAAENSRTNYGYLRKVLRLIVDEVNEQNPNDISYVYSGYAPLSIRLVQAILQKQHLLAITKGAQAPPPASSTSSNSVAQGWQGFDAALNNVRGTTFSKTQKGEEAATKARQILQGNAGTKFKTVVVMFLGGITYTEIAALRFIAKQEEERRRILICTTSIISGDSIMDAVIEKRDFSSSS